MWRNWDKLPAAVVLPDGQGKEKNPFVFWEVWFHIISYSTKTTGKQMAVWYLREYILLQLVTDFGSGITLSFELCSAPQWFFQTYKAFVYSYITICQALQSSTIIWNEKSPPLKQKWPNSILQSKTNALFLRFFHGNVSTYLTACASKKNPYTDKHSLMLDIISIHLPIPQECAVQHHCLLTYFCRPG